MPNIKSAKKDLRKSRAAAVRNRAQRSALRTALKKAKLDAATPDERLKAVSLLDRAARKGLVHGNAAARQAPPGPGNLLHLCTITREFPAAARVFSMADDPTQIYQVIQTHVRDGATSVEIFGPAPAAASLLPSR